MLTLEQVNDLPSSNKFGNSAPWVKVLPYPGPLAWRVRDAWEVLRGRAAAVRECTVEDIALWPVSDGPVADGGLSNLLF